MSKLIYFLLVLLFASCRSVQYVPIEHVQVKTEYRDRVVERKDSILVQDSIYIQQRGDTIYHDRWHIRYRERIRADTLYLLRRDSIVVPQVIQVERQHTYVERLGAQLMLLLAILILLYLSWYLIKRFLWRKLP